MCQGAALWGTSNLGKVLSVIDLSNQQKTEVGRCGDTLLLSQDFRGNRGINNSRPAKAI